MFVRPFRLKRGAKARAIISVRVNAVNALVRNLADSRVELFSEHRVVPHLSVAKEKTTKTRRHKDDNDFDFLCVRYAQQFTS
jgi:hypothetical protein